MWVLAEFTSFHGVDFGEDGPARVSAAFRDELPKLVSARGRLYLATVDGVASGAVGLKEIAAELAELKRMYVRSGSRGLEIARSLITRVIDDATSLGYSQLVLETADFMTDAHGLYRSVGFVPMARLSHCEGAANGVAEFELFMSLDLGRGVV